LLAGGASVTLRHTPPIRGWTTRSPARPQFPYHLSAARPPYRTSHPLVEAARPFGRGADLLGARAIKKALFGERRYSLSGTSLLQRGRSLFTDRRWPPIQLLTRRYTNGSKQRALARCESRYLVSFRHAKATRRPRPALMVRAELGIRDLLSPEVPTRGEPLALPRSPGLSPTACAFG